MPDVVEGGLQAYVAPVKGKGSKISLRMKRFCEEYIGAAELNATKAVLLAGYNTKNANRIATKLLHHPLCVAYLEELTAERAKRTLIDADYVIHEIKAIVDRTKDGEGFNATAALRGLELLAKHLGMFVERTEISGRDGEAIKYEKVKEDADDFARAIASLAKRAGARGMAEVSDTRATG